MNKIGISLSLSREPNEELFKSYAASGIDAMEICLAKTMEEDYDSFSSLAKKYGITLWSHHLLWCDASPLDSEVRKQTIKTYSETIKKASDAGVGRFVIHSSGEGFENDVRQEKMLSAKETLNELAEVAAKCGSVICVENLPRICLGNNSAEIKELISVNDKLRVCFDTNHQLTESNSDFLRELKGKIANIHVSDYDFINERHWLPGEGKIDWQKLVSEIKESGYDGVWMYELSHLCPKTIIRDRDLTCDDFARNAKELFEGKPLTTFCTHKENLGMWG